MESFILYKKEGKELVQQLIPMTVINGIKQLKSYTYHLMTSKSSLMGN